MNSNNPHKTAILIFAYSSEEEVKHKQIIHGDRLFNSLTARTIKTVEKSKLPYFHYSEKHQVGYTFGERFSNAIQTIFDKGYDNVITIGNDSPQLKTEHLFKACIALDANKVVFGPSTDGGFYLMGLNKFQFNSLQFKNLPWQTSHIRNAILQIEALKDSAVSFLPALMDVDSVEDIKAIVNYIYILSQEVLVILLSILQGAKKVIKDFLALFYYNTLTVLFNKGSPQYSN
mgnify:FL=1|tara:strand:- start:3610 stop:4302 length:693 start_codon:yes stop_codon:yes gene_type:complete